MAVYTAITWGRTVLNSSRRRSSRRSRDSRSSSASALLLCVCDLTEAFDLSQPTISHHLKILRDAGLVESSRRGTWAYYRLVPEAVDALRGALGG
jgi:DNA-binding transcriptional ArsR family regulator